jgi:hypothetical protein
MSDTNLKRSVATAKIIATSLGVILFAVGGLYLAAKVPWFRTHPSWQKIAQDVGSAIFVTGLLTLLWELFARRAVVAEVLADAKLSDRAVNAGIADVTADFSETSPGSRCSRGLASSTSSLPMAARGEGTTSSICVR